MAPSRNSRLLDLARNINAITGQIVQQLQDNEIEEPDFSINSTEVPSTPEYHALRDSLNDATHDLLLLVNGPRHHARQFLCTHHDLAAYQIAFEFELFNSVPEDGSISVPALAARVGLNENVLARTLYFLATQRVFQEVSKGTFSHTHGSIVFAKEEGLRAAAEYQLDEFLRAVGSTSIALKKDSPSPFNEAFGMSLFQYYGQNPKLGARFASAMAGIAKIDRQIHELQNGFPWAKIGEKRVVDIGGGSGHVSIALAQAFPNLNIMVQDGNPTMFAQTSRFTTGPVGDGRVQFMQHDFFEVQPIRDAGVYFLRQVTHNWRDDECIKIFKGIVPALEASSAGTSLLINDTIVPEHGTTTRYEEHGLRQVDIMMLVALGAKQRTEAEFDHLLQQADSRLKIVKAHAKGTMGLLEVQLKKE